MGSDDSSSYLVSVSISVNNTLLSGPHGTECTMTVVLGIENEHQSHRRDGETAVVLLRSWELGANSFGPRRRRTFHPSASTTSSPFTPVFLLRHAFMVTIIPGDSYSSNCPFARVATLCFSHDRFWWLALCMAVAGTATGRYFGPHQSCGCATVC